MDEARRAFIEEYGVMFERMGSTRMLGRVWAALMVADPPEMSAEELAGTLQASRGSISQATRQLIDLGILQRVNKPGIRRDFYRVAPNAWVEAFRKQQETIGVQTALFKRGLAAMQDASPEAQAPLREAIDFFEFWKQETAALLERWVAYKERIHA